MSCWDISTVYIPNGWNGKAQFQNVDSVNVSVNLYGALSHSASIALNFGTGKTGGII